MEQAMPLFLILGAVVVALAFLLIGVFVTIRSRHAPDDPAAMPASAPVVVASSETPRTLESEPVRIYLQADGTAEIELAGRRFSRLSDIIDDQLAQRALAAVHAMQRFAGLATEAKAASVELNDEVRAGHAREDGAFVVEYRGQCYRKLTEIRDGSVGRDLLARIGELAAFGQGLAIRPSMPEPRSAGTSEGDFLRNLATSTVEQKPLRMLTLVESLQSKPTKAAPMPVGIAGQIDQILQQQLVDNTFLTGRAVHVVTAKDGSLGVEVGSQTFKWPDEVEPIVREAVQRAIRTWERSTEV